MQKSLQDKLFWVGMVDADVIVDFGCADGTMLDYLQNRMPQVRLIGYDIDDDMVQTSTSKGLEVYSNWSDVEKIVSGYQKPMILLSSVIHEVYSYSHPREVNRFWKILFGGMFDTIVIRDMLPSVKASYKVSKEDVDKVRKNADPDILAPFEREWGDIGESYRSFMHYLLKYRYKENFERELHENYLPVSLETVLAKVPKDYAVTYDDHYVLPFLKDVVKKDFGIDIKESTHAKLIIEKQSRLNEVFGYKPDGNRFEF